MHRSIDDEKIVSIVNLGICIYYNAFITLRAHLRSSNKVGAGYIVLDKICASDIGTHKTTSREER